MVDGRSAWDGQHDGRSPEEPRERPLHGMGPVSRRDFVERLTGNFARSQREPGNKDNSIAVAIIHDVVPFTVGKAVAVLHAGDGDYSARARDVLQGDVG